MTRNHLRIFFVLAVLFGLPGCLVQTETFLTERGAAQLDERLLGVWTVPHQTDEVGFLFAREADEGGIDILTVELRDDDGAKHQLPKWDSAVAWPTEIDGLGYLNMVMDDGRLILAYRVNEDGSAEFGFMDPKPFKKAVQDGTLQGRLSDGFLGTEITLTDTAQNIAGFIRDNGGHGLFVFGDPENEADARLILVRHRLTR
jgi:hypothetical protein